MNFTKVRKLLIQSSVELKVNHLHVLCPLGILLVLIYRQSPTSLIGEPKGRRRWLPSPGDLAWGRRGSGLREAAARPGESSRRAYGVVCLRGSVSTCIRVVCLRGSPFGAQREVAQNPYYIYYYVSVKCGGNWFEFQRRRLLKKLLTMHSGQRTG